MEFLIRTYRLANVLSLDVVVGSVCCALFFAKVSNHNVSPASLAVLAFTVWVIYTVDHLRDARMDEPSSVRHRFHKENSGFLWKIVFAVGICILVLLFFVPPVILLQGIVLVIPVILYLLFQQQLRAFKELVIAITYVAGILVSSQGLFLISTRHAPLLVSFTIVAMMNLVMFSWFDFENDHRDSQVSVATALGKKTSVRLIFFLYLVCCVITALSLQADYILIWMMASLHFVILLLHKYFRKEDRFRRAGDAIFFLPGIYILICVWS